MAHCTFDGMDVLNGLMSRMSVHVLVPFEVATDSCLQTGQNGQKVRLWMSHISSNSHYHIHHLRS